MSLLRTIIGMGIIAALATGASAEWTLLDDFSAYTVGSSIRNQGNWKVNQNPGLFTVGDVDGNQVLQIPSRTDMPNQPWTWYQAPVADGPLVANNTTSTFFWRLNATNPELHMGAAATPATANVTWQSYVSHLNWRNYPTHVLDGQGNPTSQGDLTAADSFDIQSATGTTPATVDTLAVNPTQGIWYNLWMVVNSTSNTWDAYIGGGAFGTQTKLSPEGGIAFQTTNPNALDGDLVNFLIALDVVSAAAANNPTYFDDLYIDRTGANLANPLAPAVEWRKGDCDTDYDVDFTDLGTLISNYNLAGGWPQGDFGGDGTVDFTDLGDLIANYGTDYHPTPEPATMGLLALGGLGLIRRKR